LWRFSSLENLHSVTVYNALGRYNRKNTLCRQSCGGATA